MPAAFPGAYGWGASTPGGRGGTIHKVTNLSDSGAGSLRAALEASGARIVVFEIAGVISLSDAITINDPYLTVAGQTAPGDGITITGDRILVYSTDMIFRYLRWRGQNGENETGCFVIREGAQNLIIDHCSLAWGNDDIIDVWYTDGTEVAPDIQNITIQNCLIAEGLWSHPTGANLGGNSGATALHNKTHHITFWNNLWVNVGWRTPTPSCFTAEIVNQYVYNWQHRCHAFSQGIAGANLDFVRNYYDNGPMSGADRKIGWYPFGGVYYDPSIYVEGNIAPDDGIDDPAEDNWPMVRKWNNDAWDQAPTDIKRTSRQTLPTYPCPETAANSIWERLNPHIGAAHHLTSEGKWLSMRDSLDVGWINDVIDNTGEDDVETIVAGTIPTHDAGTVNTDTDDDGMPDDWETPRGLNPSAADDDGYDLSADYTNIEMFLNGPENKYVGIRTG